MQPPVNDQLVTPLRGFANLESLGAERIAILESRLVRGDSAREVAEQIQKDWGESLTVAMPTLIKQIQRYKEKVIAPRIAVTLKDLTGKATFKTTIRKLGQSLELLEELYQLADTQKARVRKMLEQEEKMPSGFTNKEIRSEIHELMNVYQSIGHFQLETGVLRRTPKSFKGSIQIDSDNPSLRRFELSVADRDEVLQTAQRIGVLLDGVATVVHDDAENYPLVEE